MCLQECQLASLMPGAGRCKLDSSPLTLYKQRQTQDEIDNEAGHPMAAGECETEVVKRRLSRAGLGDQASVQRCPVGPKEARIPFPVGNGSVPSFPRDLWIGINRIQGSKRLISGMRSTRDFGLWKFRLLGIPEILRARSKV